MQKLRSFLKWFWKYNIPELAGLTIAIPLISYSIFSAEPITITIFGIAIIGLIYGIYQNWTNYNK